MLSGEPSSKQQIKDLILVLLSGVLAACIISGILLYKYGPTGVYTVTDALIDPTLATTLDYNDHNDITNGKDRFVFNGIEFSYYDSKENKQKKINISSESYKKFYNMISLDKSILNIPPEISNLFNPANAAILNINVRTESHAAWQNETKQFQSVNFAYAGDYYRIKLHEEKYPNEWVYFHHPAIYQQVLQLFVSKP
jgi:hypothetical protein